MSEQVTSKQVTINVRRYYYGGKSTVYKLIADDAADPRDTWTGTRKEALAKIEALQNAIYILSHNEAQRPTYTITYK